MDAQDRILQRLYDELETCEDNDRCIEIQEEINLIESI